MTDATPRSLKYAHVEREHRYLLSARADAAGATRRLEIHDRYVQGTRLRVRRVEEAGQPPVYKFGQKARLAADEPLAVAHTTMYLSSAEYDVLRGLPGDELTKTRYVLTVDAPSVCVDVFTGRLSGLRLAEVDVGAAGTPPHDLPIAWVADVSADPRFTGPALARTTSADLQVLLVEYGLAAACGPARG